MVPEESVECREVAMQKALVYEGSEEVGWNEEDVDVEAAKTENKKVRKRKMMLCHRSMM